MTAEYKLKHLSHVTIRLCVDCAVHGDHGYGHTVSMPAGVVDPDGICMGELHHARQAARMDAREWMTDHTPEQWLEDADRSAAESLISAMGEHDAAQGVGVLDTHTHAGGSSLGELTPYACRALQAYAQTYRDELTRAYAHQADKRLADRLALVYRVTFHPTEDTRHSDATELAEQPDALRLGQIVGLCRRCRACAELRDAAGFSIGRVNAVGDWRLT